MYLKTLELQGFKSFPDRTVIRFGGDITAIVGPNGSGKSNISDAILWVMGEQSSKTLRGTKMEDVIFGGTARRPAQGFAEATLTLDNADRALSYDADEVVVTRRYYRSGDGEYYINRQSARLKDIHELLMDTGLGREGYSNIGQGRIDEILALRSEDRREVFEEAAGISKYRHRKEETQRQLEKTEDNLLRIGDKVSELELQLEPLKLQAEKAKRFLELKEELRGLEVAVWMDTLEKLSAAAQKAQEDYNTASFVLRQAHEDLEGLYRQAESLTEALRQKDRQLEEARGKTLHYQTTHQQLEGRMAVLRGNMENNQANLQRIEEELQGAQDRSGGIDAQLQGAQDRVRQIDRDLEGVSHAIAESQGRLSEMTASAQGISRRFLELRERESSLTAGIAGCEAECRAIEENRTAASERRKQLEEDMAAGTKRQEEAAKTLEDSRKELARAKEQVAASNNVVSGVLLRQKSRKEALDASGEALRELTAKLEGVAAKVRVFRAMERDFESYQKSVRMVMQEAGKGRLKHIHGPVSRLIRTEDRYTVAIEIALGAAMQQIVVDSEQDGKAAIGFLKRTGGGRATFLPLSGITGKLLREPGVEQESGFVGIASELVSFDPKYEQIIRSLLGRTVIAADLDGAIAMAKRYQNRFRIVTLDGQVMNAGGSMTGGSVNREAGLLSRANELQKLIAQEEALTKQKQQTEQEEKECRRLYDQAAFQLTAAQDDLRQAEDQVLRLQGQEKQFEVMYKALQEAAGSAKKEWESLRERDRMDAERQTAQRARAEEYEEELRTVRQQLQGLEGSQSEAKHASDTLTAHLTELRTREAALAAEKNTALGHMEDLRTLRAAMDGDREKKQALMDSIRQENGRLEEELQTLEKTQQEGDRAADSANEELRSLLEGRTETEAQKTRAEREAQEKNRDILNMERACALLEQKKATTDLEEKQIIDRLWDTYGLTPGTAGEKRGQMESPAAGNRRIGELKRAISDLGTPNLGAIDEYARVEERYRYLTDQRDDVLTSKRELEGIIRDITREMTAIFVEEFAKINENFQKVFEEMFGGGKGQLLLDDPSEPLSCGIEIRVQPPGKQVKTITLLSGGEKALVATALYFAILKVRPTPFCLLDEIDAALDDRNVDRFASYLRNLKQTQFIVITHRRGTMETADVLYGVTMQEQGVSKLLRLDLNQMEEYLGIEE